MPTIEPKHIEIWKRASELTQPGPGEQRAPVYSAYHRQRSERRVEREEARDGGQANEANP
jgi:hypothetical protein